jgi:L1 cell adhesion molecule like protein
MYQPPEELVAATLNDLHRVALVNEPALGRKAVIVQSGISSPWEWHKLCLVGSLAGYEVLRVLRTPVASTPAFCADHLTRQGEYNVMTVSFGAGILDVCIATIEGGITEIKAVACDRWLGEDDIDRRLVQHLMRQCKEDHHIDILSDKPALSRLRLACESTKFTLSSTHKTEIVLDNLIPVFNFASTQTRMELETICDDLLRSTMDPIQKVLRDGRTEKNDIEEVVLIGVLPAFLNSVDSYVTCSAVK